MKPARKNKRNRNKMLLHIHIENLKVQYSVITKPLCQKNKQKQTNKHQQQKADNDIWKE